MTHHPDLIRMAKAIARAMNGSTCGDIGTADDIEIAPEDIYAAQFALRTLLTPTEDVVEKGGDVLGVNFQDDFAKAVFTAMINRILETANEG